MPTRYARRPASIWAGLGKTGLHIYASSMAQVQGLCGTFTWKQQDDFVTPAGDIETSVTAFASKFQVSGDGRCPLVDSIPLSSCSTHSQRLTFAEAACAVLHGPTFQVPGCPSLLPTRSRIQNARQSPRAQGDSNGLPGDGIREERADTFLFARRCVMG